MQKDTPKQEDNKMEDVPQEKQEVKQEEPKKEEKKEQTAPKDKSVLAKKDEATKLFKAKKFAEAITK